MDDRSDNRCEQCGKTFARHGQLRRHALIHSQERRYTCSECAKSFLRRDALLRHEQLHRSTGPNLLQRRARACLNCAAAKARCSGDPTCIRCAQRSVECRYAETTAPDPSSRPSASIPDQVVTGSYDASEQPQQTTTEEGLHQPVQGFYAQFENTVRLPHMNINWLASPMNASGGTPGSYDTLPWLFDDSQLWGDLHDLPFGITPALPLSTYAATRRGSEALLDTSTLSTESPATSAAPPTQEAGEFYVDGDKSRLPHVKRRKLSTRSGPKTVTPIETTFSLGSWTEVPQGAEAGEEYRVPEQTYHTLRKAFSITCLSSSTPSWTPFGGNRTTFEYPHEASPFSAAFTSALAPKEVFDRLLSLYMDHFQPIIPLFRPGSLPSSWQVLLAMCALGSHFGNGNTDQFIVSIHEFMRRILHVGAEDPAWLPDNEVEIAQVRVLHTIGLVYCGDERLLKHGLATQNSCVDIVWKSANQEYSDWETWIPTESARRTSYAIWLVDCMMAFHFHQKPVLQLEHASTILPCHQKVWAASEAGEWEECCKQYPTPPTLAEALQQMYVEKRLVQDLGEFARVLAIHGIFHRTWQVATYYEQPLSRWSPKAEKQSSDELNMKTPTWLPSVPTFAKWRNSACDCIDILHWSANAAIGAAAGMEPPHIMHLHFARVVLLTPHNHIVSLARYLAGVSASHTSEDAARDRQVIRRWATQDQYKARLAMIHAGVMFWHVRRFSANGFYEPTSVALSALSLWAFSAFSARPSSGAPSNVNGRDGQQADHNSSQANNNNAHEDEESSQEGEEEEDVYDIILLDRPTDDELVQQFVRRGPFMKANMNGVGDLYGDRGPERVLVEGRKLLATLNCWGIRDTWVRVLDKLITVTRQERKNAVAGNA